MVNYGYNDECRGWNELKKHKLYRRLVELMKQHKLCVDRSDPNREGFTPYLELDGIYGGVRIRAITHLSQTEQENLIKEADKIYIEVMEIEK